MAMQETVYWRTSAGLAAWASPHSGLPPHYRAILGALDAPTAVHVLKDRIRSCLEKQLLGWLEELETLGLAETGPGAAAYHREAA